MTLQIRTSPSITRRKIFIAAIAIQADRFCDFYQVARWTPLSSPRSWRRSQERVYHIISRAARVYTIVIKIIVDISPAIVPAPPFCPNYFLTQPIKGAGARRYGGCSSGSSRRHNRKTGRPSVIKTARVGVQTSLALSSSRSFIFFFLSLCFSLFPRDATLPAFLPSILPSFSTRAKDKTSLERCESKKTPIKHNIVLLRFCMLCCIRELEIVESNGHDSANCVHFVNWCKAKTI